MTERKPIYTAEARVTGGRAAGHGRASDGALEVVGEAFRVVGPGEDLEILGNG